jgi:ATP-dependent helicase HrpB
MSNPFNVATCLCDLPVNDIVRGIVEHSFIPFSVSLVTSRTGSGKTVIVPAALAQAHGHCIYVIEPRRILAIDAARNLSRIYGVPVGSLFGYGVGSRGGEESKFDAAARVVFVTTGYAIASGIINTGTSFVIDEYHETTLDLSIAKAILESRRREGQDVRLVMMSATGDEAVESAYWAPTCGDFPVKTFHTDGVSYPCEFLHRPAHSIRDSVIELLSTGSTGILGFLPGQEEINDALRSLADVDLFQYLPESAPATACVSISSVHGQMDADQRDEALRGPSVPGEIRILLGTNVIESGINLAWVDSGVTSGQGRSVESRPNGSTVMTTVDLCRARIDQQKGRVNRFRPGKFILAAPLEYAKRKLNEKPEILKTSLERVVISCARMGIDPRTLRFDTVRITIASLWQRIA